MCCVSLVLLTSVCWKWGVTALSWSSTRRPLRSMSRCVLCALVCSAYSVNTDLVMQAFFFSYILCDLGVSRLEPTQWTTHCWNTAPKSTSSKPPSVISLSTSSMLRRVSTFCGSVSGFGEESGCRILTHFFSLHRLQLKNMRRCSQLSPTLENANCWR